MHNRNATKSLCQKVFLVFVSSSLTFAVFTVIAQAQASQAPALFTYQELVRLYEEEPLSEPLRQKLERLTSTPVVHNGGTARPLTPEHPKLGKVLRVAVWNIERGLNYNAVRAALSGPQQLARLLDNKKFPSRSKARIEVLQQARLLREADVIVLNEVDWGVKRTAYRDVARDLAAVLGMNYAWGAEFVEIDPLMLGTEKFEGLDNRTERAALLKQIAVNTARTRNLHGTAILSRYELTKVRLLPFNYQGHDWYLDEKKKISKLEEGKRKGATLVFNETILREVRRGGRMMLLADIEDAQIPGGRVTIVATHLEDKVKPEGRVKQLNELLSAIKDIPHPVIVAGDMNTNGTDATPVSLESAVKSRLGSSSFWVNKGIKYATGVGLLYDVTLGAVKSIRTKNDPTVKSVKFVSENPEENFFTTLKEFRFADGGAFDFRGSKDFSIGNSEETFSDSNERASKGFVPTFALVGKISVEFKLDWIFVKPVGLTDPDDRAQPYNFAPSFGRTLKALNESVKDRISDHNPITADLPFANTTSHQSDLAGTSWQLVKFQGSDDSTLTPDDKTKYILAFGTNGRLTARLDCNRGAGTWKSAETSRIEFGPLALTRAMCPAGSLHNQIAKHWPHVRSYVIKDGHLYLSLMADGGTYEFEPFVLKDR